MTKKFTDQYKFEHDQKIYFLRQGQTFTLPQKQAGVESFVGSPACKP